MVILEADILSMFAKVDAVDVFGELLGRERVAMTPAIRDEISVPLQYGYTFLDFGQTGSLILSLAEG